MAGLAGDSVDVFWEVAMAPIPFGDQEHPVSGRKRLYPQKTKGMSCPGSRPDPIPSSFLVTRAMCFQSDFIHTGLTMNGGTYFE